MKRIVLSILWFFAVSIAIGAFNAAKAERDVKEIAKEGRFIAYDNGTVLDTKTGLMWAAQDDGKGMNEQDARAYFANYRGGGYRDWRIPTIDELEVIYDDDIKNSRGYHITRLIQITGQSVWGLEGKHIITAFDFRDGSRTIAFFEGPGAGTWYASDKDRSVLNRALPVRDAGNAIYNLTGEWDAVIDHVYVSYVDVLKIIQKDSQFVGIRLVGSPFAAEYKDIGKGCKLIRGELEAGKISKVEVYEGAGGPGWADWFIAEIGERGNKIVIKTIGERSGYRTITLKRK